MIRTAHQLGMLTTPYAFNETEAEQMADAGADILVAHMGLTTKGSIGAQTALTLEDAAKRVQAIHDAAKGVNPEILVICHGGPIAEPEDATYVLENTEGVVGFYGASSAERLPTERAITAQIEKTSRKFGCSSLLLQIVIVDIARNQLNLFLFKVKPSLYHPCDEFDRLRFRARRIVFNVGDRMTLRASVLEECLRCYCVVCVGFHCIRFNVYIHFHGEGCNLGGYLRFVCPHLFLPLSSN